MSHVELFTKVRIMNLDIFETACKRLHLDLKREQKHFKWYGRHVGDYPMPAGFTRADMGRCEHAVSLPGNKHAYEAGLVPAKDGQGGWFLMYDFYGRGFGLEDAIGKGGGKLLQAYAHEAAKQQAISSGQTYYQHTETDGTLVLEIVV